MLAGGLRNPWFEARVRNEKSSSQNPKVLGHRRVLLTHSLESEVGDSAPLPSQQDASLAVTPLHQPGD